MRRTPSALARCRPDPGRSPKGLKTRPFLGPAVARGSHLLGLGQSFEGSPPVNTPIQPSPVNNQPSITRGSPLRTGRLRRLVRRALTLKGGLALTAASAVSSIAPAVSSVAP